MLLHYPVPLMFTGDVAGPSRGVWFPTNEHWECGFDTEVGLMDVWKQMEWEVLGTQRVRRIGCSNCGASELHELTARGRVGVSVNQVEGHLWMNQRGLVRFGRARGVDTWFFGGFGGAGAELMREPGVLEVARRRGCTAGQVLLAWGAEWTGGGGVIASAKGPARMAENLAAREACGEWTGEELEELAGLVGAGRQERFYAHKCFESLWVH